LTPEGEKKGSTTLNCLLNCPRMGVRPKKLGGPLGKGKKGAPRRLFLPSVSRKEEKREGRKGPWLGRLGHLVWCSKGRRKRSKKGKKKEGTNPPALPIAVERREGREKKGIPTRKKEKPKPRKKEELQFASAIDLSGEGEGCLSDAEKRGSKGERKARVSQSSLHCKEKRKKKGLHVRGLEAVE